MANLITGTLGEIPATRFFHLLNLAQKTGTYHLYQKTPANRNARTADGKAILTETARISFENGALIHATTTGPESHLLSVLYKAGNLNQRQYQIFSQRAAAYGEKALALLLINANYLSQRTIIQAVQQHILDVVYSVMARSEEEFTFTEGELPSTESITVWINIENIVAEHSRRKWEFKELTEIVPNLDVVLKFPSVASPKAKMSQLTQDEWRVLSMVNAKATVGMIAKACHMTELEIRRNVSTLIRAGLVEAVNDGGISATAEYDKNLLSKFWSKPVAKPHFSSSTQVKVNGQTLRVRESLS